MIFLQIFIKWHSFSKANKAGGSPNVIDNGNLQFLTSHMTPEGRVLDWVPFPKIFNKTVGPYFKWTLASLFENLFISNFTLEDLGCSRERGWSGMAFSLHN